MTGGAALPAFYEVLDETPAGEPVGGGRYRSAVTTVGPWDPGHQHGGPPAALLVRAVERLSGAPDPGLVARATMEILGPVPVADLQVSARLVRAGARIALCEAVLTPAGDDRPVARMAAWRLRTTAGPIDLPATRVEPAPPGGAEAHLPDSWGGGTGGYLAAVEWRWVEGAFEEPGPACAWTRLRVPVVGGEDPTGVQRVLAVADSGSGLSAAADIRALVFVNTELSVHLTRAPAGERVWMRSSTALDAHGVGLASTVVGDVTGAIGSGAQTLFVAPR